MTWGRALACLAGADRACYASRMAGPGAFDLARLLRILLISAVLMGAFVALEPHGLGWLVIPGGLAVAILIILLALWRNHRARKTLTDLQREIDELKRQSED